jgi:hypothetical protein
LKKIKKCPKCNGEVEKGLVFGAFSRGLSFLSDKEKDRKHGFFENVGEGTESYRCKKCGYIEVYAIK